MLAHAEREIETAAPSSMDTIFDSYVERIFRYLYRRLGNREDAEDLTSEVFLKAARELDVHRAEASIASWLYTVARTVLMDHWRRYYRHGALLPFDDLRASATVEQTDDEAGTDIAEQQVAEILAILPQRYRTVLELRFLRGLSLRETAEEMGITRENVKVTQHRALARATAQAGALPVEAALTRAQQRPLQTAELRS